MTSLRLAFMGTPDFSVPCLHALVDAGHDVCVVYSQPPRAAGRGQDIRKTPVHMAAEKLGIEVRTPTSLKGADEQQRFADDKLDVAIVVAYGLILPKAILEAPQHGCFNIHASLLPRWRGAAPIQRAIMAGDKISGTCIMQMDEGLDTGDVVLSQERQIEESMTAGELHDVLSSDGASLIVKALEALTQGNLQATPQPEDGITYANKIDKKEAKIDWTKPAAELDCLIRGLSPFPGAWFELPRSKQKTRVKVLRAEIANGSGKPGQTLDDRLTIACGEGSLRLTEVQKAGKKVTSADDFLRGTKIPAGTDLA